MEEVKFYNENLNENKDIIIKDFKEYLQENYTEFYNNLDNFVLSKSFRSFEIELKAIEYVDNYITSLHYDIQNNTEDYTEQLSVENKIIKILLNYLGVDTSGN